MLLNASLKMLRAICRNSIVLTAGYYPLVLVVVKVVLFQAICLREPLILFYLWWNNTSVTF